MGDKPDGINLNKQSNDVFKSFDVLNNCLFDRFSSAQTFLLVSPSVAACIVQNRLAAALVFAIPS